MIVSSYAQDERTRRPVRASRPGRSVRSAHPSALLELDEVSHRPGDRPPPESEGPRNACGAASDDDLTAKRGGCRRRIPVHPQKNSKRKGANELSVGGMRIPRTRDAVGDRDFPSRSAEEAAVFRERASWVVSAGSVCSINVVRSLLKEVRMASGGTTFGCGGGGEGAWIASSSWPSESRAAPRWTIREASDDWRSSFCKAMV